MLSTLLQHRSIVEVDPEAEVDSNINGTTAVNPNLQKWSGPEIEPSRFNNPVRLVLHPGLPGLART